MKHFFIVFLGTFAFIAPLALYARFFSSIPCPDCKYLGTNFDSWLFVPVLAAVPIAIEFFLAYLLVVREKVKSVNPYLLAATAATFALLHTFPGSRVDSFVAEHFSFGASGMDGYLWPLSVLADLAMAALLSIVVFRRDLLRAFLEMQRGGSKESQGT